MQTYKIHIHDRGYTSWTFFNTSDSKTCDLSIVPTEHKLFTNDVFSLSDQGIVTIVHSSIQSSDSIPGVLILKGNKTYGRQNGHGKLLYKCVPDDMRLPCFLVPYEIKNMGFSKVFTNQYVTFHFKEWKEKHPHATLSQVLGPVDVLDNFYEYQLYCKSLNASIQKFTKDTSKALNNNSNDTFSEKICKRFPNLEDRTDKSIWHVFSIDPPSSMDFDDAFSIRTLENNVKQLSIYISNVTIWIEILNLWESFSRRISTIYLPDKKRPMLPTILSDSLCSLQENHTRFAFVMDIFINTNGEILDMKYSNCKIKLVKNYVYEDAKLLGDPNYHILFEITKVLSKKYKYLSNMRNSHELVAYLMIFMNYHTAKEFMKHGNGIFRSTVMNREITVPSHLPEEVGNFIKIWNSSSGQYIDLRKLAEGQTVAHDLLDVDAYIHITSPIRRIVDLLNIIQFQQNTGLLSLSEKAHIFYNSWIEQIGYINTTMRSIRRVQNDCSLLHLCNTDPTILSKVYEGYTFDKLKRDDGLYQMMVFLPELRLTSKLMLRDNLENFSKSSFKLYIFNDEEKFKKKIRLQLIE